MKVNYLLNLILVVIPTSEVYKQAIINQKLNVKLKSSTNHLLLFGEIITI